MATPYGHIPRPFIDELIARTDIVEIIDGYVSLKKKGANFSACCPFHTEKTASFTVNPAKQFYYCFGCGVHGNVLTFIMEYDHQDFITAIETLASKLGLEIPKEVKPGGYTADFDQYYHYLHQAKIFYQQQLRQHSQSARVIEYLKQRGLSGQIAKRFGIGFAPPGWDNLFKYLKPAPPQKKGLAQTGLFSTNEQKGHYDRFRDRVMFPIHDIRGRVIAFGGRVLGNELPKYINSPETPVFHKNQIVYGLYEVLQVERKPSKIIVVEGYMDVISLAQHHISNAVATLGTAVGSKHIQLLYRYTREIVFCFDGDTAGQQAAARALEATLPFIKDGRKAGFVFLPNGEDPDSLIQTNGPQHFTQLVQNAIPLSQYLLDTVIEKNAISLDDRASLVSQLLPFLQQIPPGIYLDFLIDETAKRLHTDSSKIAKLINTPQSQPSAPAKPQKRPLPPSMVRLLITQLLHNPKLVEEITEPTVLHKINAPGCDLLLKLIDYLKNTPAATTGHILHHWANNPHGPILAKLAASPSLTPHAGVSAEFKAALQKLEKSLQEQQLQELLQKARHLPLTVEEKNTLKKLLNRD